MSTQEASGSNAGGDVLTPQFTPQQIEEFNKQLEGCVNERGELYMQKSRIGAE
jgi:hypothetical protein